MYKPVIHLYRYLQVLVILFSLSACSSIDYFSHLAKGQFSLLWAGDEVAQLVLSEETPAVLKSRLKLSQEIRAFASEILHLPVGDAYSSYSDLKRPYVVWNVYAAPALSFESYTWCYPVLGCMAYRGFYEQQRATEAAAKLEREGYDVKVGGVRAYSTLGYFDDPLLNTFIFQNQVALVELLIHEIAHRLLYIKDDTKFNENFASAVGSLGAEVWYRRKNDQASFEHYQKQKREQKQVIDFLLNFKKSLSSIYTDPALSDREKKQIKDDKFKALKASYTEFKIEHHLDDRYDNWVYTMNNAGLSTLANYQELEPGFIAMFQQLDGDWKAFYQAVEQLSLKDKQQRYDYLKRLAESN